MFQRPCQKLRFNFATTEFLTDSDQDSLFKVVVQPAPSADLSGVVFSLSNPNVSPHVTGQMRTLQFLQIANCSFSTQNTLKYVLKTINKKIHFFRSV